jgi:alanyl-tRNA synthetase
MLTRELREAYLEFFRQKDHLVLPSASLVPENDPTLIFVGAGMVPFKAYYAGTATPPRTRLATCQKCVRTTDIDDVGDFQHCTFFEMLGNFSFGDYFKAEVIPWAWEFLTEWLKIDPDRLCVTVFKDDDEAFRIWNEVVGLPVDRIHRLDEDKNFWPANSATDPDYAGVSGPCSEIFFRMVPADRLTQDPALTPTQRYIVDDKAGRWTEIWNLVFTQFNRDNDAEGRPILIPLPKQNIDTGMGLDRVAMLLQGGRSIYDNDQLRSIVARLEELSGRRSGGSDSAEDSAFRLVTEHLRSMTFIIADGVVPGNTDRSYVLRRIVRRAILRGKMALGFEEPFLDDAIPAVIETMASAYPELRERESFIVATARKEEELFRQTLERGIERFTIAAGAQDGITFSGEVAFRLYETYGFPLDLTQELAAERGFVIDMEGYRSAEEEHRKRSGAGTDVSVGMELGNTGLAEIQRSNPPTEFVGYSHTIASASIVGLLREGERIERAQKGDEIVVVLDRSPFYAEAGGPVGDVGTIEGAEGAEGLLIDVLDTQRDNGYWLHRGVVRAGKPATGMGVRALVDAARRQAIKRNHTATHLLQAALRRVLGDEVHQAGSRVEPDQLRFDFTYPSALTREQLDRIEQLVNDEALADAEVLVHDDVSLDQARERGAMALFGEKYGSVVRMVEIPGFSLELCGGIHLGTTAQVGLFKILSEGGIAAGVRRIVAVTGAGAYDWVKRREQTLVGVASLLRTNPNDLVTAAERLIQQRQELERQVRQLKTTGGAAQAADFTPTDVDGIPVVVERIDGADAEAIAALADRTAGRLPSAVILLAGVTDGKIAFASKVTKDLVARGLNAGALVREVARMTGGGGGGRPDFAQAGGRDASKLPEALAAVPGLILSQRK